MPYAPGSLKVVGVSKGADETTMTLRTAGPLATLRLTPDRTQIAADGQDLSYVTVEAFDADGTPQPNADDSVSFTVDGPATIAGIASGDLGTLESFQAGPRRLFHGHAQVILRSTHTAGAITLRAQADASPVATADVRAR